MVEIFKTNITDVIESEHIKSLLLDVFSFSNIHFDLEDCDKILRIDHPKINNDEVIELLKKHDYNCQVIN